MKSRLLLVSALVFTAMAARSADALCPKLECGTNSPLMDFFEFHELSPNEFNAEGLRLVGLWSAGTLYQARVASDRLQGIDGFGNVALEGADLVDGTLDVITSADPPVHYYIHIKGVSETVKFWVDPGEDVIETYFLTWSGGLENYTGDDEQLLCPRPPTSKDEAYEGVDYAKPYESVLFSGDRYNATDKTVIEIDPAMIRGWFNIACAGNALYKMYMTRHTTAGSNSLHLTDADQRQAMLKMYVSDVCGNGDSNTEQGTRLHWNNFLGWGFLEPTDRIEAFWGPKGALCFKEHRLGDKFIDDILDCLDPNITSCDDAFPNWANHWPSDAYVVSMIPK